VKEEKERKNITVSRLELCLNAPTGDGNIRKKRKRVSLSGIIFF